MNRSGLVVTVMFVLFLGSSVVLTAQSTRAAERRSVGKELDVWVSKIEEQVVPTADAMPEEKFGFVPTAGTFEGTRSFAEQVKHLAATNYILGSAVLGEKPPHQEQDEKAPDSLKSKAEIMEYLKGSFALLHRAAAAINSENEVEIAKFDRTRPGPIMDALIHCGDHYGQMVEYLRMSGIIPPASR
jgi:DinB superfamily